MKCWFCFFSDFPILHEWFSNTYGFVLLQEFNPFYPHLVLCDRKHFCSVLTDLSNLLFLFHQKFLLLCSDVKNVLTKQFPKMQKQPFANVVQKQSQFPKGALQKRVLRDFAKFTGKHLCQSLFINKVAGQGQQLYLKRHPGTSVSCEFWEILKNTFLYRTPLIVVTSSSKLMFL